eukprot:TRINITY_DN260_c0_g1_i1.p1 TRINITY_DN260_c0_g1~~TRINITY_DN260_c0_g1_i1.p1  ORF type:complete len:97 (+),score=15.33 TRINITY_DN260_c0_g1_i1:20-310(+)
MHPPLHLHLHPKCKDIIIDFENCHKDNPWMKFFGVCNQKKRNLNKCLDQEYIERKNANKLLGDRRKKRKEELLSDEFDRELLFRYSEEAKKEGKNN